MLGRNKYLVIIFLFIIVLSVRFCIAGSNVNDTQWLAIDVVKIAAAQVEIHTGNEVNIAVEYINQAGKDKADMIVFSEYLLGAFYKTSEDIQRVAKAAKENNVYVVIGAWEEFEPSAFQAKKKDAYANTALIFDRSGDIIGKYNKIHRAVGSDPHCWPPKGDEPEWLMKAGDEYPTFLLDFGRIGIMTCYDGFFPESATSLSLNGAEIILWMNARAWSVEDFIVKADMFRNYCAMVSTNFGQGSGTMIGTWPCDIMAHVTETGNHYITAEIDLKTLRRSRANSRVHHQRRPEVYNAITEQCKPWEVYQQLFPPENSSGNIKSD